MARLSIMNKSVWIHFAILICKVLG